MKYAITSAPFSSVESFRQQFNQGLHALLEKHQLGTFILCLANATNDAELFSQLESKLSQQFQQLLEQYQAELKNGVEINAVEEDLLVFLKLHALGFDNIQLTQQKILSPWRYQFNQLRSFRPKRMVNFKHNGEMLTPFMEDQFNFNKPFMAKECFWQGEYEGKQLDLFYNKYPFADLHGLIVPQREKNLPQFLTHEMHDYIWRITQVIAQTMPGIGLAYNSYGAYASVNHLHFQMFISESGMPVSDDLWCHNGGQQQYPLPLYKEKDSQIAWQIISQLHHKKQPYHCYYSADGIIILPRALQGSIDVPRWSSGFTWYEACGAMLLFNQADYMKITAQDSIQLLSAISVIK